jgi:RNA polymerase sigma-B factor
MAAMVDEVDKHAPSQFVQTETPSRRVLEESLERLVSARRTGDPVALRRCESAVVDRYRPIADRIARRYRGRGVEDDDLVQLARLGLCKAVRRWSPDLDPTLVQFATPTIEGEIKRYFRDHCRPIRMPRSLQEDLAMHQSVHDELTQNLGRTPTEAEIAAAAGSTIDRVRRQRLASRVCQPVAVDAATGPLVTGIPCEASAREIAKVDDIMSLRVAVCQLPERDRRVLALRFGLELSQTEIAARIGVSQMQVSRMLKAILTGLRAKLA